MSLLPQELSCPQEGLRMFELPSLKRRSRREDKFVIRRKRCTGPMWDTEIVDGGAVKVPDTDHNITPLVEFDWQVSVRLDPFSIGRIHH